MPKLPPYEATVPLKGNGSSHNPYAPDVESQYSWRIIEWIGNYNVVKIEVWEEPIPEEV
jgi:hypothetical protein